LSSGPFVFRGYQAQYEADAFHPIRIQPETEDLVLNINGTDVQNDGVAASATTNPISARVSGSRRGIGLYAALLRFTWDATPPTGYLAGGVLTLPAMNFAIRVAPRGSTGTYLGTAIRLIGTVPESSQ
jgi:hypothetical protein